MSESTKNIVRYILATLSAGKQPQFDGRVISDRSVAKMDKTLAAKIIMETATGAANLLGIELSFNGPGPMLLEDMEHVYGKDGVDLYAKKGGEIATLVTCNVKGHPEIKGWENPAGADIAVAAREYVNTCQHVSFLNYLDALRVPPSSARWVTEEEFIALQDLGHGLSVIVNSWGENGEKLLSLETDSEAFSALAEIRHNDLAPGEDPSDNTEPVAAAPVEGTLLGFLGGASRGGGTDPS